PGSAFVCADADDAFPFVDGSFSAAICSDAFHCFVNKSGCIGELRRCTAGGTVIVDRTGNSLVEPNEGFELSPRQYSDLMEPVPHVVRGEGSLVDSYLAGTGPRLRPRSDTDIGNEKWLSLVMSDDPSVFVDHGRYASWPHIHGRPAINPVYQSSSHGRDVRLRFEFPSKWYAFENARMGSYLPHDLTVSRDTFDRLLGGGAGSLDEDMVRQCVVIGLPERYI
ncbi:MAG: class I SAM-dependent methyltransferase, partial [bacterium]